MLIRRQDLDRIVDGRIDLAFRRWKRPTVKTGGTLRTVIGVLAIHAVDQMDDAKVTNAQARRAGFASRAELLERMEGRSGDLYRVRLSFAGADPRVALRNNADLSDEDQSTIRERLARFDKASRKGPWTKRTLALIRAHPATLAADLAAKASWEKVWFKTNVRKLKNLGLTESLDVGYRLSPRGKAFLGAK